MERIAKAGHIDFAEVPAKWQRVFVTANAHHARVAHPDAGGLPGALRLGHLQDVATSRTTRPRRTCEEIYELAYELELQGRHGLPRRQPRHAGAVHRRDRQEGDRQQAASRRRRRTTVTRREVGRAARASSPSCEAENERLQQDAATTLEAENLQRRQKRSRPSMLRGTTRRMETPLGTLFVHHHRGRSRASRSRCS